MLIKDSAEAALKTEQKINPLIVKGERGRQPWAPTTHIILSQGYLFSQTE